LERRLAAILAADVVGYTRLMGADEAGTLERLQALRKDMVQPRIAARGGRIVKLMGDGLLAEFPSVVEAVQCAVDIQQSMIEREVDLADDQRIRLRIGVNLGDIIVEGSDIYGDGVNVAARLEGLASPGGICVSGTVFDHVKGKVALDFVDLGKQPFKNIDQPVQVYGIARDNGLDASEAAGFSSISAVLPELSDKPSIAVLPFTNMSGDPEQQYFSDGITADIITELSRFGSLSVVARSSTFVYRDQAVNVSDAGKVLGARYLLEGSLRKAGDRIRLTAQLIDVETGKHIWAERYDRVLEDVFAIQDELVQSIVATLAGRLQTAHMERSVRKHTENLVAYDYYLKALQHQRQYDFEGVLEGREFLEKAVQLDPNFARAHALLSYFTHAAPWFENAPDRTPDEKALAADEMALALAHRAVQLDPDDNACYANLGVFHANRLEFDKARHYLEQALALNPHDSETWGNFAYYLTCVGEHQRALDFLAKREAIEPFPPNWHWEIRGRACYFLGQYQEAVDTFGRMARFNYWNYGYLAACYGQLAQVEEARANWSKFKDLVPGAGVENFLEFEALQHQVDIDHWRDGLRKAGIT
jgi:TolB-like protein